MSVVFMGTTNQLTNLAINELVNRNELKVRRVSCRMESLLSKSGEALVEFNRYFEGRVGKLYN